MALKIASGDKPHMKSHAADSGEREGTSCECRDRGTDDSQTWVCDSGLDKFVDDLV